MSQNDELMDAIKAALSAPAADYVLCATVSEDEKTIPVILDTVQIARSLDAENLAERLRGQARRRLVELGFDPKAADTASVRLEILPDVLPVLDQAVEAMSKGADDMILLDLLGWQAAKFQTRIQPTRIGSDEEIVYRGLRIRCSATD